TENIVKKINNVTEINSSSKNVVVSQSSIGPDEWGIIDISNANAGQKDALLEDQEQFTIYVQLSSDTEVGMYEELSLEIRPAEGASYAIKRSAPPKIDKINILR
ncbi:MAG: flagellin, partial [Methanomicrobium sp.]|nr:flagellin [Methanomicrobium sp.]